jgi:hypothetical protein
MFCLNFWLAGNEANGLAGIAQLVEQRIRNAKVVGSTPIAGTRIQEAAHPGCFFISGAVIPL